MYIKEAERDLKQIIELARQDSDHLTGLVNKEALAGLGMTSDHAPTLKEALLVSYIHSVSICDLFSYLSRFEADFRAGPVGLRSPHRAR